MCREQQLKGDDEGGDWQGASWGGSVAWRARLFLFVGFALLAGGLAGSIVSSLPPRRRFVQTRADSMNGKDD